MPETSQTHRGLKLPIQVLLAAYVFGMAIYILLYWIAPNSTWWFSALHNFLPYYFLPLLVLIPLALLLRMFRMALLQIPLLVLALIWFGPYYLPKNTPQPTNDTIRIVTFNIWGENPRLPDVEAWLRTTDADVVFLQEIPESLSNEGLPNLHERYPYQHWHTLEQRYWGNMILSKHPILDFTDIDMEGDGVPTQQRFTLDINEQPVIVYNIHFMMPMRQEPRIPIQSNSWALSMATGYDERGRNGQINTFLEHIAAEIGPVIVAGDFNMSDHSSMYRAISAQLSDAFRDAGVGLGGSWPIARIIKLPEWVPSLMRIDYIWHSEHFRTVDAYVGPDLGSDHLPHVAGLEPLEH